ncbi:MAG: hypothetical protein ACI84C_001581 [Flavobacteriales bacterium]|jgi:hypothetical protein
MLVSIEDILKQESLAGLKETRDQFEKLFGDEAAIE